MAILKAWKNLAMATWPSSEVIDSEGWIIHNNGDTGGSRANSVQANGATELGGARAQRYQIWQGDEWLSDILATGGYAMDDPAYLLAKNTAITKNEDNCVCEDELSLALASFFHRNGIDEARTGIMRRTSLGKCFVSYQKNGYILGAMYIGYDGNMALGYSLVVNPNVRRQGIARAVMNAGIGKMARIGVKQIAVMVTPNNNKAITLYEQLGFTKISRYWFMVKEVISK